MTKYNIKPLPVTPGKYTPYHQAYTLPPLVERRWPDRQLSNAPRWCVVDLRDGNQALSRPMNLIQKKMLFDLLVAIGFTEIEISFPSASSVEYDFTRYIVEEGISSNKVWLQVLTQSRAHLIDKTIESITGASKAIIHLYNSTSRAQRRVVFNKDKKGIIEIALAGTRQIKQMVEKLDTEVIFEYSPESFTGTEIDYALELCLAVCEEWHPQPDRPMILNLPATVELCTPNIYADRIEYFAKNLGRFSDSVTLSVHTHNDRGTGVAATELGLLAGATRVEGTLFGYGERTGNVDLLTVALNHYVQGIDPGLALGNIPEIVRAYREILEIPIHERHPYSGDLVFTAFSGPHQDAIRKGLHYRREEQQSEWDVPYIPIDPTDIGREVKSVVRITSQSGKGGVAFVLEEHYGFNLPKKMHPEFSRMIQKLSEETEAEVMPSAIYEVFERNYLNVNRDSSHIIEKVSCHSAEDEKDAGRIECILHIKEGDNNVILKAQGNGPIDAASVAFADRYGVRFEVVDYSVHTLSRGSHAQAASYIGIIRLDDGHVFYGVGCSPNTMKSSMQALLCALNRAFDLKQFKRLVA